MTRGKSPTAGLEPRICTNVSCGKRFQPYRSNQFTCSRKCYTQLPEVRDRESTRRHTPDFRAKKNEWRRTTPTQVERTRDYNRKRQLARYGTTPEQYEARLAAQNGVCMICGKPPKPGGVRSASRLHQDHDHETGRNRDLLCLNCNNGIGYFHDDPVLLRAAAEYIDRHRA